MEYMFYFLRYNFTVFRWTINILHGKIFKEFNHINCQIIACEEQSYFFFLHKSANKLEFSWLETFILYKVWGF